MFYKWILNKVAGWVARYPRTALSIVIGYVALSVFELIPVVEIVSDFVVVLGYVLLRLYIAKKQKRGGKLMNLVLLLCVNTLAVLTGSYLLKGVKVDSVTTALVVAIVLGLVNTFVKPFLVLLTLPVTILTLGLFLLVINALMIQLTAHLVSGFRVENIWWAMGFSVIISIVSSFLGTYV